MIHAKDELTVEYALVPLNGQKKLAKTLKAKAKTNGEDVLTPLIEQAATNMLTSLMKTEAGAH